LSEYSKLKGIEISEIRRQIFDDEIEAFSEPGEDYFIMIDESDIENKNVGVEYTAESATSGGVGRLAFFLLVFVLAMVGGVAGNSGAEGIEIVVALAVLTVWMFRCKNIGRSPFYALLGLIPIVNLFILGQCLSQPPGYYQHNNMDLIGKFILFLYIGFFVLIGIVILSAL